ncbi:hypothetical protein A2313_01530 [Candidatus Roizmanbacteria bacterium RIFOXYB2_FULL_41_10]|uniref:Plasmid stabilization protein n=1 Tax=Candidatus Roizmanbacteria bacterium RIFOXYA1_FULL_41_12 TaxID=1802082 RepID=A0A1F7KGK2_9BACT|nr:MAG: hypothetical protein A2262_02580 [Candidatus Roizmanbacteria bacterium RIFOXYA2_FULL_41_8]OGK66993.1 MAG: hypothetical protein A2209_02965 [Candidatus Roizmanbacteria bacterium RIFOXYA1_FULL_41_12]OGK71050.1 MAG: hypothetical protein A2313_01530 [Candidatus Roizmanbacteria bacterium RIFOXYB2_FULL_41_10]OGK71714.1 MAG: hypothetical protein A2403_04625 [Candidatus Roizmanbacteria bacterium RIFOXYC1_FULL_41_16]OGK72937.1 MAG: hypothetical protein A2459_00250 [Candidatus Roizmanbacteria bac
MTYQIFYVESVLEDIQRLDNVTKKRLKKKIEIYIKNPLRYASKLISPSLGTYRWRIGNYRVVFDLKDKQVIILKIKHRREIYR